MSTQEARKCYSWPIQWCSGITPR